MVMYKPLLLTIVIPQKLWAIKYYGFFFFPSEKFSLLKIPHQAESSAIQCEKAANNSDNSVKFRGVWATASSEGVVPERGNPKLCGTIFTVFLITCHRTVSGADCPLTSLGLISFSLATMKLSSVAKMWCVAPVVDVYLVLMQLFLPPCCSWA